MTEEKKNNFITSFFTLLIFLCCFALAIGLAAGVFYKTVMWIARF